MHKTYYIRAYKNGKLFNELVSKTLDNARKQAKKIASELGISELFISEEVRKFHKKRPEQN